MIKYLSKDDKDKTKDLYKEAFEDSDEFIKYYYEDKIVDNEILVYIDEETNKIKSMMHLNPYPIRFFKKDYSIDYIVAVATANEYKRQGLMRKLMIKALHDMYDKKKPFTFLLPAKVEYYESFDFVLENKKYKKVFNEKSNELIERDYKDSDKEAVVSLINLYMLSNFKLFNIKTQELFDRYLRELKSENGFIKVYENSLSGILAYKSFWGKEKIELRDFICLNEYQKDSEDLDKRYMFRIVNLEEFISNLRLKENSTKVIENFKIRIKDDIIEENSGSYLLSISKYEAYFERLDFESNTDILEFTIKEFADFIFNGKFIFENEEFLNIETINDIFINEEV